MAMPREKSFFALCHACDTCAVPLQTVTILLNDYAREQPAAGGYKELVKFNAAPGGGAMNVFSL
jgi:hypothetical protein